MSSRIATVQEGTSLTNDLIMTCTECGIDFVHTIAQEEAGVLAERCGACGRLAAAPGRTRGIVKWFNRAKGYGFITPIEGPDLFLHRSSLRHDQPLPVAEQLVEFKVVELARGVTAEDVTILNSPTDVPAGGEDQ